MTTTASFVGNCNVINGTASKANRSPTGPAQTQPQDRHGHHHQFAPRSAAGPSEQRTLLGGHHSQRFREWCRVGDTVPDRVVESPCARGSIEVVGRVHEDSRRQPIVQPIGDDRLPVAQTCRCDVRVVQPMTRTIGWSVMRLGRAQSSGFLPRFGVPPRSSAVARTTVRESASTPAPCLDKDRVGTVRSGVSEAGCRNSTDDRQGPRQVLQQSVQDRKIHRRERRRQLERERADHRGERLDDVQERCPLTIDVSATVARG